MKRPATSSAPDVEDVAPPQTQIAMRTAVSENGNGRSALAQHLAGPHSLQEAEERYVAARDAWTAAMRAAGSGRPADMASLAIAQEAFEAATADRNRWQAGERIAIPIRPTDTRSGIEAAVGQELAWRRVLKHDAPKGLLGRIRRALGRR